VREVVVAKAKSKTEEQPFDVVIIGAGPAGATAGLILATAGRRVAVVDREKFPRKVACAGWLSAKAEPLLAELKANGKGTLDTPFSDITFFNADFSKKAKPHLPEPVGYLVDRTDFDNALVTAATGQGADFFPKSVVRDVRLREAAVEVFLEGDKTLTAKLLLLASGRNTELLSRIGYARRPGEIPLWSTQVEAGLKGDRVPAAPSVIVVLGLDGGASFGLCTVCKNRVAVNVNWRGEANQAIPQLVKLCRLAHEKQVLPVDLSEQAASAKVLRSPAGAALDMESHVAKHTLLIGDAGGFIAAASNEGIYPAMWSAKLAAKAIESALQSQYSQDQLMSFDSLWRMEMADYLRSPHTDIRFLLPLIFSNQPMADRMGAAFFFGENI
jgi:flavin-dependent dehydrogenase